MDGWTNTRSKECSGSNNGRGAWEHVVFVEFWCIVGAFEHVKHLLGDNGAARKIHLEEMKEKRGGRGRGVCVGEGGLVYCVENG